ncbi:MAG: hypothetical protein AAFQ55_05685, partial [Pseudomonadota bacterium]
LNWGHLFRFRQEEGFVRFWGRPGHVANVQPRVLRRVALRAQAAWIADVPVLWLPICRYRVRPM